MARFIQAVEHNFGSTQRRTIPWADNVLLTGGNGAGKTTTINALLLCLGCQALDVKGEAPLTTRHNRTDLQLLNHDKKRQKLHAITHFSDGSAQRWQLGNSGAPKRSVTPEGAPEVQGVDLYYAADEVVNGKSINAMWMLAGHFLNGNHIDWSRITASEFRPCVATAYEASEGATPLAKLMAAYRSIEKTVTSLRAAAKLKATLNQMVKLCPPGQRDKVRGSDGVRYLLDFLGRLGAESEAGVLAATESLRLIESTICFALISRLDLINENIRLHNDANIEVLQKARLDISFKAGKTPTSRIKIQYGFDINGQIRPGSAGENVLLTALLAKTFAFKAPHPYNLIITPDRSLTSETMRHLIRLLSTSGAYNVIVQTEGPKGRPPANWRHIAL